MPQNFSFYVGKKTYPFLLDVLAERRGFRSRSDLLNQILTHLFIQDGLLNPKTNEPTDVALKLSRPLRRFVIAQAKLLEQANKKRTDPKAKKRNEILVEATKAASSKRRTGKLQIPVGV